jgi:hypothetical protein
MRRSIYGLSLALAATAACTNAGEKLTLTAFPTGGLQVLVYFDRDASHSTTSLDTVYAGARVALVVPGGTDTIRTGTSNAQGLVTFDSLPLGTYRVVVDRHALSDSIGVIAGDTGVTRLIFEADSSHLGRIVRLGYTETTLAGARALPAGRRVIVRGTVTSPLQAFRDSSAFLVDTSGALRITAARPRAGGGNGNNIGDSVFVLGTTGSQSGQNVLAGGIFSTYTTNVAPIPVVTGVVDARTAKSGLLDAVLVQLNNVVITDTAVSGPDFLVQVADPANVNVKIGVLIDQLLLAPHGAFVPGRNYTFRGVLVPVGDGTWVLKPRGPSDVVLNN